MKDAVMVGLGTIGLYGAYRLYKGKPLIPVSADDVMSDFNSLTGRKTTPSGKMAMPQPDAYIKGRSSATNLGEWTTGFFMGGADVVKKAGDAVVTEGVTTMTNVVDGLQKASFELPKTLGDWTQSIVIPTLKQVDTTIETGVIGTNYLISKIREAPKQYSAAVISTAQSTLSNTAKNLGDTYGTVTGYVSDAVSSAKSTLGDLFRW